jgi:hypothetical protein
VVDDPAGFMIRRCGALSGRAYAASFQRFSPYWQDHLHRCRRFISEGAHKVARKTSVTVVGASQARDLPLEELAREFDTVNLVDIDEPSMQLAVGALRQGERTAAQAGKVRCVATDITGNRIARLAADCFDIITNSHDPGRALCRVAECYECYDPSIPAETVHPLKASYVVSSGVASQLFPLVAAGVKDALGQRFPRFRFDPETQAAYAEAATGLRRKLIEQHVLTLAAMAEDDGLICWWDTVSKTPAWGQLTGQEQLGLLGVVSDWVQDTGSAVAAPDLQAVLNVREPRQLPGVLTRLIRENLLPVPEVTALIDRLVERADEMSASARAVIVPGGLAGYDQGLLVPDGPLRSWRWILDPLELSSLQVEAVHLKRLSERPVPD